MYARVRAERMRKMKQNKVKKMIGTMAMIVAATELLAGCGNSEERSAEMAAQSQAVEDSASENSSADSEGMETETAALSMELEVRFGDSGEPFEMHMENNETAQAIVRYVGTSDWRLPIYDRDDDVDYSVMEYYDIPSRYEILPARKQSQKRKQEMYSDPTPTVLYCFIMMQRFPKSMLRLEPLMRQMSLSAQWKTTRCWKDGEIRLFR